VVCLCFSQELDLDQSASDAVLLAQEAVHVEGADTVQLIHSFCEKHYVY